jgi:hypothetical protein
MAVLLGAVKKGNNIDKKELIGKIYDYIVAVTIKQGKLLPVEILYGDGSRFNNDSKLFILVYEKIKEIM